MSISKTQVSSTRKSKSNRSAKPRKVRRPFNRLCRKVRAGADTIWRDAKPALIAAIAFGIVSVLVYVLWSTFWPGAAAAHAVAPAVIRPLMPHAPSPIPTPHPPIRHG